MRPSKKKRYSLSEKSIFQKFFDFYSMYELYLRCGGFRDIGYGGYDTFVNEGVFNRISSIYEGTVEEFYELVYDALVMSIQCEIRHFPGDCQFKNGDQVDTFTKKFYDEFEKKFGISRKVCKAVKKDILYDISTAHLIFAKVAWCPGYGGQKWGKGVQALIDAEKVKTLHDKVQWIDRVMDLYHNNGHLLNKTHFSYLSGPVKEGFNDRTALDFRAKAKTILKFTPFNSDRVKQLVLARQRILN